MENKNAKRADMQFPREYSAEGLTRIFLYSIAVSLAALILNQAAVISVTLLSGNVSTADGVLFSIADFFEALTDTMVFASGIAPILFFSYHGQRLHMKKHMVFAFVAAVLFLEVNYTISFMLDLIYGNIDGYIPQTIIYQQLNIAVRLVIYILVLVFSSVFRKRDDDVSDVIPFVSKRHRVSGMLKWTLIIRMVPYIIFEIYANVTGIIEYGVSDMEVLDVLSIISAYLEILFDGICVYAFTYLCFVLFEYLAGRFEKKNAPLQPEIEA